MSRFLVFSLLTLVLACRNDSFFDENGYYGNGTATLNGVTWNGITGILKAKKYCYPDTCISIAFRSFNKYGMTSKIVIDQVPLKKGKFQLNPITTFFNDTFCKFEYIEIDPSNDQATGVFVVTEADSFNYIEIQELDVKTGDIRGKFNASVVRYTELYGGNPDIIDIENGNFYGKIKWQ